MIERDNRGVTPSVAVILVIALFTIVMAIGVPMFLDITAIEGVDKSTSGVVSNVSVDDEDTRGKVVMVFNVSVSEPIDRVEVFQQTDGNRSLVKKTAVLPEERVATARVEGEARTQHELIVYRDGEIVGTANITVRRVPVEKQFRTAVD